jgi:serine/threonine-protein kinase
VQVVLTFESGREKGQTYRLHVGQTFVLGRGRDVSIRVEDEKVSRRHATIGLTTDGLEVQDLGSRNGTLLDGKLLDPKVSTKVKDGAAVDIGDARVRIKIEGDDPKTVKLARAALPELEDLEVLGEIGRGATGRVYVARQKLLDRTVAVKALKAQYATGTRERERFLREGMLAARVKSPHVVEVYDVRVVGDRCYIIMELVQGPSAKDRLGQGQMAIVEALKIGEDIALALAAAADAGIVHRDVKPGNILIGNDGRAKLADFGIAKVVDSSSIRPLTATGDGLGTLAYVSPEQAENAKQVDRRTDIYGLGATIYHLIAGRPPFLPTSARVLLDILDKPPPPIQESRSECPEDIAVLVHRMLEKDPNKRPQSAREVAMVLKDVRQRLCAPSIGKTSEDIRLLGSGSTDGLIDG